MAAITATCATLVSAIAASPNGGVITLRGDCPPIVISSKPRRVITIEAAQASIRGLTFQNARGFVWRGGVIRAAEGAFSKGPPGYGARVLKSENIKFEGVTFTDANRGLVGDEVVGLSIQNSTFHRVGQDGMILSRVQDLVVFRNVFKETIGKPSVCAHRGRVETNVSGRDCKARGGEWTDGYHADAVQMRDGVKNARISYNKISGSTQGITQMDKAGDAPLANIVIENNVVSTDNYHRITLAECFGCSIRMNKVSRSPGSTRKAIIIPGAASVCGNIVQDAKVPDKDC